MTSKMFWIFMGPRLIRVFGKGTTAGHNYVPGNLEGIPDRFVSTIETAFSVTYYTSPVIGAMLYRRGYFTKEGGGSLMTMAVSICVVYVIAVFLRGMGRFSSAEYRGFITALLEARGAPSAETKKQLSGYDYEYWAAPVDFRWDHDKERGKAEKSRPAPSTSPPDEKGNILQRFLGYMAVHTFGRRMIYPGATGFLQYAMGGMLNAGRAQLVEEVQGQRAKLLAEGGTHVDTMFMDRRGKHTNGHTLVIGFEGNAGFYEMGCTGTPLDLNYSVLGWNHPGFAGSSGIPSPQTEQRSVDVVMQYAIHRLGFDPHNIVLFAWSIGGYSAAYLAKTYPDIKHVILDATFDDLVPLAITKMPQALSGIVRAALRSFMDLNVAQELIQYDGPVLLIKRTRDEIITTETQENGTPVNASNRGNFLLIKLLQHRYPTIVDRTTIPEMLKFLGGQTYRQAAILQDKGVIPADCHEIISSYASQHGGSFPMRIEVSDTAQKIRLALYLATVHMENFESTHCSPLPGSFFRKPWNPLSRL